MILKAMILQSKTSSFVVRLSLSSFSRYPHILSSNTGRVLVDDRTLESYRISDKGFLVLMISRVKTTVAVLPDFVHLTSSLNIAGNPCCPIPTHHQLEHADAEEKTRII
jgi:hypothetical protein